MRDIVCTSDDDGVYITGTEEQVLQYVNLVLEIRQSDSQRTTALVVEALREYIEAVERESARDIGDQRDSQLVYASSGRSQDMRMPSGVIIRQNTWRVGAEHEINNQKGR